MNLFDDEFGDSPFAKSTVKPFHSIKKDSDKELLEWLNTVSETLKKQAVSRNSQQRSNLEAYRGITSIGKVSTRNNEKNNYNKANKFAINHLYDLTETKVSQMTRIKPAVDILPTNDEFEDKTAAKAVKFLINHLWYLNNMDDLLQKMQRYTRIFGESYLFIKWDKDMGDLHPLFVAAKNNKIPLDLLNEAGNSVMDSEGKPIKIDLKKPIYTGDVEYKVEVPWRVLLQRKNKFEDVEYCFHIDTESTDTLKKENPKLKNKLKSSSDTKLYDVDSLTASFLEDETVVYEFFHKKTKHCSEGYYCRFTQDVILERKPLPYSHGDLPFERLTDIEAPEKLNGISAYEMVRPIQNMHNNLSTLLAKNIYLTGHAKWVMPRGACKLESLGNDSTIVQYQGPVPPQLLQVNPNPPEAYSFRSSLIQEMGQVYGVQGVSRGAPPEGITAGVALQFLNEQEQERATNDIAKHNSLIQKVAKKTIAVAGDYYAPDDGRMLRIVGKDNKYAIRHFDSASLSKNYDVRIQIGSALPESKAGKIQRIVEIMQMKPDLLSNERWIDLLDLGNSDKMMSLITTSIRTAESENEDLLSGKPVGDPEVWENHILHWKTHVKAIQNRYFKEETPLDVRNVVMEHIAITEYAMVEKAQQNQAFEAQLAALPLFPIFANGFTPRSKEHMESVVQGEANRGAPLSGNIPGTEENTEGEPFPEQNTTGGNK
jgi:hypothetical protein